MRLSEGKEVRCGGESSAGRVGGDTTANASIRAGNGNNAGQSSIILIVLAIGITMSVWANNMVGYVAALCLSICMIFYCRGYKLPFIREACILKSGDRGGSSMKEGIFSNKEVHPGDNKTSSHILWTEVQASANLMKSKGVDVLRDSANNCGQLLQKNLQAMHPSIPIIVYVEDDTLECGHPHVDLFINFKGDLSQNDLQIALDSTSRTAQGVESLELLG